MTAPNSKGLDRFNARAKLYNTMAADAASRIADAWGDVAPNQQQPSKVELAAMWNFTRSPNPAQEFYQRHDLALQQNLSQIPDTADVHEKQLAVMQAHQQAEQTAMDAVYPYRAVAYMRDALDVEQQVKMANRVASLVSGQQDQTAPQPTPQDGGMSNGY